MKEWIDVSFHIYCLVYLPYNLRYSKQNMFWPDEEKKNQKQEQADRDQKHCGPGCFKESKNFFRDNDRRFCFYSLCSKYSA